MTVKFTPRCGYLGCDPKVGECLGFCNKPEPETESESQDSSDTRVVLWACTLAIAALSAISLIWGLPGSNT